MGKPLKIAVDVRDLRVAKTGTRTYLEEICREFKKIESNELHFHFLDTNIPVYTGGNKLLKLIEHARYQFWKQLLLPLKAFLNGCDIVFCTDNFVPIIHLGFKTVPVFHDAFFFESPEDYGKFWLWFYYKLAIPAAKRAAFIVTPTDYAKKQIAHFTQIDEKKLVVIYESAKKLNSEVDYSKSVALLKLFKLLPQQYLLHVGSMFKRKNIPVLIHAFRKLKNSGYSNLKLVLAGPTPITKFGDEDFRQIQNAISDAKLENEIILTGYITDDMLSYFYKNALLYVFPSLNEGFGIPVLEAFKYDLPVLVADNTCLQEVGGNAVLQFDPFDPDDIFRAIKTVLDDPELQKEMINKGRERLKDFSWKRTATEIVEVFKKAV